MLRIIARELLQRAAARSSSCSLVSSRATSGPARPAGHRCQVLQQAGQPGRRLEEDDAPFLRGRTGEQPGPLARPCGDEAQEEVAVRP